MAYTKYGGERHLQVCHLRYELPDNIHDMGCCTWDHMDDGQVLDEKGPDMSDKMALYQTGILSSIPVSDL